MYGHHNFIYEWLLQKSRMTDMLLSATTYCSSKTYPGKFDLCLSIPRCYLSLELIGFEFSTAAGVS